MVLRSPSAAVCCCKPRNVQRSGAPSTSGVQPVERSLKLGFIDTFQPQTSEQLPSAPNAPRTVETETAVTRHPRKRSILIAGAVTLAVILVAVLWVVLTQMRPSYDAFGWLVWGRQTLHGNLNTDGAPSWKPLTFLFTLPYALAGAQAQMWLWMITSTAAAFGGAVFAARIAYRLTGPSPRRTWAPYVAAGFAAVGVLGIDGYSQLVLIASSDPMVVTLCLGAIDSHLSGHPRLAYLLIVLAAVGRPEAWAFAGIYAVWVWRTEPSMRIIALLGLVLIPVAWFTVPALTSHTWFSAGDLALNSKNAIHGNKIVGVFGRLGGLYELPMQLTVAYALVLAAIRRDRVWLTLAGTALLWVVIEIAFAYHGWSAVPRYLLEPAAVLIVLAGAAVGRTLTYVPGGGLLIRWAPSALVLVLVVTLVPAARSRLRVTHGELHEARSAALELTRLQAVIRADGGAALIKSCGQPVTLVGKQSEVAWAVGLNVGNVGYRPGKSIEQGIPIVVLKPHDDGWQVRPIHVLAGDATRCQVLRIDSAFGTSG